MRPLFQLLIGKQRDVQWNDVAIAAFEGVTEALARASMLVHPRADAPTALTVDASDSAVSGALELSFDGHWRPLAFFSRQFNPVEKRYSTFDREFLALHLAVQHFRYFLESQEFIAFTDHKPFTFAFAICHITGK